LVAVKQRRFVKYVLTSAKLVVMNAPNIHIAVIARNVPRHANNVLKNAGRWQFNIKAGACFNST
jgi:hypothetical protein